MLITTIIASVIAAAGIVITTVQTAFTIVFRRRFFGGGLRRQAECFFPPAVFIHPAPFVSILKPVCGLDDDLRRNLESFTRLRGIDYEVIISIADPNDPALPVVDDVMRGAPNFRLVMGGDPRLERGNRKVARLIAASPHARGDVLLISDSNVRVEPVDVAKTMEAFRDPNVGCVSNLFTGDGAQTLGASIESLHLLSFVVTGAVLAATADVPCVVGKSMAISRKALNAIGGFRAFAKVLAEDQAIGLAVRRAGYDVVLSPVTVRNVIMRRTLRRAIDRQVRWNKIRFAFSKATYSSELVLLPLPFAILATLCGVSPLVPLGVAALRMAQIALLAFATGARVRLRELCLVPLLDVLQFAAQFVPYFDDRVTWRGYTARIGANTELTEIAA